MTYVIRLLVCIMAFTYNHWRNPKKLFYWIYLAVKKPYKVSDILRIGLLKLLHTRTRRCNVRIRNLSLGHHAGQAHDRIHRERVRHLKSLPDEATAGEFLDLDEYGPPSDGPIIVYKNLILNGNGRIAALWEAGLSSKVISIIERY